MPNSAEGFQRRIDALKGEIVAQGRRVQSLVESAFDAVFTRDEGGAGRAAALDETIDKVDVEIEKSAVALLTDACGERAALRADQLRLVLTIVKVNNELERIADAGVGVAEEVRLFKGCDALPTTFRVMANSVVGIVRDATDALDRSDSELARVVLLSEEATTAFRGALVRDAQQQYAAGKMGLEMILGLSDVARLCVNITDHATNIAEQVIYSATGTIVRHMQGHWEEVKLED
jgi:phosphate transport system protein